MRRTTPETKLGHWKNIGYRNWTSNYPCFFWTIGWWWWSSSKMKTWRWTYSCACVWDCSSEVL